MNKSIAAIILLLSLTGAGRAQNWAGILANSRAIDWSGAGVVGGIPTRTTICSTINPYGTSGTPASPATINSAIAACPSGQVVFLTSGDYYLNAGVVGANNVTLRGAGGSSTRLHFTAPDGCGGEAADICVSASPYIQDSTYNKPPCVTNYLCADWTAGYAQGATAITVANVGFNGIYNGQYIILDQAEDTAVANGFLNCSSQSPNTNACSMEGGSPGRTISSIVHTQQQIVKVTAGCATACIGAGPFNLTITPGLYAANWSAGKSPGVFFTAAVGQPNSGLGNAITGFGVEDLMLDNSNSSGELSAVAFVNAFNCWASGIRSYQSNRNHFWLVLSAHITIQNSYTYGTQHSGITSYGFEPFQTSDSLIINNITQHVYSPEISGPATGLVMAYNFSIDNFVEQGVANVTNSSSDGTNAIYSFTLTDGQTVVPGTTPVQVVGLTNCGGALNVGSALINGSGTGTFTVPNTHVCASQAENGVAYIGNSTLSPAVTPTHDSGTYFSLYEGNIGTESRHDHFHGTGNTETLFRNYFNGYEGGKAVASAFAIDDQAINRYLNAVGNVLGQAGVHSGYKNYTGCVSGCATNPVVKFGFGGSETPNPPGTITYTVLDDPLTYSTSLMWANYDVGTGAVRFCGNSSDTGWVANCGSTSEVPTGLVDGYANAVPTKGDTAAGQAALPASFFLSGPPSWWGSVPWPAIGPDVTGGTATAPDMTGTVTAPGGHAYAIPAENCYYNTAADPAYPNTADKGFLLFDANTCYAASPVVVPAPARGMFSELWMTNYRLWETKDAH